MIHAQELEMTCHEDHTAWPMGERVHLRAKSPRDQSGGRLCTAEDGQSASMRLQFQTVFILGRSVRYNQAAIQENMSRAKTWLETSPIKRRWINR